MAAGQKRQSGWKTARHPDSLFKGFIRDFALVWAEEGLEAVRKYAKNAEAILWAAADGHELQRKVVDMHKSYQRLILSNHQLVEYNPSTDESPLTHALTEAQFRARIYNLCQEKYGHVLTSNGKGWYEYTEKMMRGYARLKAEAKGVELFPDHPLIPKGSGLPAESRKVIEV